MEAANKGAFDFKSPHGIKIPNEQTHTYLTAATLSLLLCLQSHTGQVL